MAFLVQYGFTQTGKVGVNNASPNATLDVTSSTDNSTMDIEGLLIPRISKDKAYNMATGGESIEESNVVYVNDLTYTNPEHPSVAEVSSNGYYYWNGSKWIRLSDSANTEWVNTNDTTFLVKRAMADFKNDIFYTSKGQTRNLDENEGFSYIKVYNNGTTWVAESDTDSLNATIDHQSSVYTVNSKNQDIYINESGDTSKTAQITRYLVNKIDSVKTHTSASKVTRVPTENNNDYTSIQGQSVTVGLNGTGDVTYGTGLRSITSVANTQTVSEYATGMLSQGSYSGTGDVGRLYGHYSRIFNFAGSGTIDIKSTIRSVAKSFDGGALINFNYGIYNTLDSDSGNTGTGNHVAGIRNLVRHTSATSYPNIYGILSQVTTSPEAEQPDNIYGMYLENVSGGMNNYAIVTNDGLVSFKDNVGIGVTDPSEKLEVKGKTYLRGESNDIGKIVYTPNVGRVSISNINETTIGNGALPGDAGLSINARNVFSSGSTNEWQNGGIIFTTNANPTDMIDVSTYPNNNMVYNKEGDLGIGTTTPDAKLEVDGYIKLGSADTTGDASPKPGMLRYNTSTHKFEGFVGGTTNAWVELHM